LSRPPSRIDAELIARLSVTRLVWVNVGSASADRLGTEATASNPIAIPV
jgi:hypothetical protein